MKNKLIYLFTDARVRIKKNADLILFYLFIYLCIFFHLHKKIEEICGFVIK
jgi:hypothetical protein